MSTTAKKVKAQIGHEMYRIVRHLGGSDSLQAVINSYGDGMHDVEVLRLLKVHNRIARKPTSNEGRKRRLKVVKGSAKKTTKRK